MPRKIQSTYTKGRSVGIAEIGDSLVYNTTFNVMPQQFHLEVLAASLRALKCPVYARNFGFSGNTTTQIRARIDTLVGRETPKLAILGGGVNDPGNSIVGATTQGNQQYSGEYLLSHGVDYLLIWNTQYLNYTSGGDTVNTPWPTYATLRPFQKAASDALIAAHPGKVAFCDTYAFMRQKIVDGIETANSASWHVAPTDQHLNVLGQRYVAEAMLATIVAQPGWIAALGGSL